MCPVCLIFRSRHKNHVGKSVCKRLQHARLNNFKRQVLSDSSITPLVLSRMGAPHVYEPLYPKGYRVLLLPAWMEVINRVRLKWGSGSTRTGSMHLLRKLIKLSDEDRQIAIYEVEIAGFQYQYSELVLVSGP